MNTYFDEESTEKEELSQLFFRIQVQNRIQRIMKSYIYMF
jgi:hypothetical protein